MFLPALGESASHGSLFLLMLRWQFLLKREGLDGEVGEVGECGEDDGWGDAVIGCDLLGDKCKLKDGVAGGVLLVDDVLGVLGVLGEEGEGGGVYC